MQDHDQSPVQLPHPMQIQEAKAERIKTKVAALLQSVTIPLPLSLLIRNALRSLSPDQTVAMAEYVINIATEFEDILDDIPS